MVIETFEPTAVYRKEADGGYFVFCPQVKGVFSEGDTLEEARVMIKEALEGIIEVVLEKDLLTMSRQELNALAEQARTNHPELRKMSIKIMQLDNERRLAAEFVKPRLDINYSMLNQPFNPWFETTTFDLSDNYKFGLDFSFPLFIRKERAKLAQTRIKISGTEYERTLTERQIINDINATYNAITNTAAILVNLADMVNNYERLLRAELLNLENGESDLFKINIQQEKLIESQTKLVKLLSEYEKQKAMLYWAAGIRNLGL
ncbi:MAG: TolC family protein [Acidobacteria bacterium]|nr:TolC family protein [Acidobacteriota bacterium]